LVVVFFLSGMVVIMKEVLYKSDEHAGELQWLLGIMPCPVSIFLFFLCLDYF